jgi:peroxiredoxin
MPPPPLGGHALRYMRLSDLLLTLASSLTLAYLILGVFPQQRFVIITEDDTIKTVIVEEKAGELTVTEATNVLARL